ncbi:gliotoxin biosynthesis protein [Grosmannia clavigera kw1407]|uniref:gamma-glutamylcyclotransferase n=1 Tax=Grosmannia clavigera (strain kw1407 / UAMH 11150) TaxID=655863 RepID=F0XQV1_GROCL|nr:gliotoxin biosynthesis protein [Grosmannia clavigera kw1407]EFW99790.1 gliotoxin biosynthesis protein [Grosmannia clavigera kw1407]
MERPGSEPIRTAGRVIDLEKAETTDETRTFIAALARPLSTVRPSRVPTPRTSASRLAEATPDVCSEYPVPAPNTSNGHTSFSTFPSPKQQNDPFDDSTASTVLYLAYGSNMAAATFEGQRGIRPLSCVSVAAPSLQLTFDLPGLPYREPCFANTAIRRRLPKIPDKPKLPPVPVPVPPNPGLPNPPTSAVVDTNSQGDRVWNGGLYGVVYEVSRADYAHIIATEGGGVSYQDLLVPCLELPPSFTIPEKPLLPRPPRPFLAHTLWAPQLPGGGDDEEDGDDDDDDDGKLPAWLSRRWRLLRIRLLRLAVGHARPDPNYAQPSPRYLALLVDGARQHDLPLAYQDWLVSLTPYRVTTCRQRLAAALLLLAGLPFLLLMGTLTLLRRCRRTPPSSGDTDGQLPLWLRVAVGLFTRALWWMYDHVMKPVFGDGERSEKSEKQLWWDYDNDDETAPLRGQEIV